MSWRSCWGLEASGGRGFGGFSALWWAGRPCPACATACGLGAPTPACAAACGLGAPTPACSACCLCPMRSYPCLFCLLSVLLANVPKFASFIKRNCAKLGHWYFVKFFVTSYLSQVTSHSYDKQTLHFPPETRPEL